MELQRVIAGFERTEVAIGDKSAFMQGAYAFLHIKFEEIGDSGATIPFGLGHHRLQSPAVLPLDLVLRRLVQTLPTRRRRC